MPKGSNPRWLLTKSQRNKADRSLPAGVCKFVRRRELRSGKIAPYLVYSVNYTKPGRRHAVKEFICGRVGHFSEADERQRRRAAIEFRRKWEQALHRQRLAL